MCECPEVARRRSSGEQEGERRSGRRDRWTSGEVVT